MRENRELEKIFIKHGYEDFRWIDPKDIVVTRWVRMKCTYGCPNYGKSCSCPPNTPPISECRELFAEYENCAIFHFEQKLDDPEARHKWSRRINLDLLKLERDVFVAGYHKTFLMFMDTCGVCTECAQVLEQCKQPKKSRPSPESMGVDVFSTVRKCGYPIEVLSEYDNGMNRYAFLLTE